MNRVHRLLTVVGLLLGSLPCSSGAAQGLLPTEPAAAAPPPPPAPSDAPAQSYLPDSIRDVSEKQRPFMLSLLAYVPWWYGLGIGFKTGLEIPVAHNGLIPGINDAVSIEPSFSFAYSRWNSIAGVDLNALRYTPAVSALWSFYFSPQLRVYGAINLGYTVVQYTGEWADYYDRDGSYFYGELSGGLVYNVSDRLALRAELGWQGLRGGLSLAL